MTTVVTDKNTAVIQIGGSSKEAIRQAYKVSDGENDHSGVESEEYIRTGGLPGNTYKNITRIRAKTNVYDVHDSAIMVAEYGGNVWTRWTIVAGPYEDVPHDLVAHEYNTMERAKDYGLQRERSNNSTTAIMVVPEQGVDLGDGKPRGFNGTFGIMFCGGKDLYIHNPLFWNVDSCAPNGLQALHRGGSVPERAPAAVAEVSDCFKAGVDFTKAKFTEDHAPAVKLASGQSIAFGDAHVADVKIGNGPNSSWRRAAWLEVAVDGQKYSLPLYK